MRKGFLEHVKSTVDKYTTYFLVDLVRNSDYFLGSKWDERHNNDCCERIVSVMVLEKDIKVGYNNRDASLIHYLCTYPAMQGQGYATPL